MTRAHRLLGRGTFLAMLSAASLVWAADTATVKLTSKPVKPVPLGGSTQLQVDVDGPTWDTPLRWTVEGEGNGSVDDQGKYTAPAEHATPADVKVSVLLEVEPPAKLSIVVPLIAGKIPAPVPLAEKAEKEPPPAAVAKVVPTSLVTKPLKPVALGGETPLGVVVKGAGAGTPITWTVQGDGNGSVDDQGVFHAPKTHATPATISITASVTGDSPASAKVSVSLQPVSVVMHASPKPLQLGEAVDVTAKVAGATGDADGVTWTASNGATIDDKGHLTPPATMKTPGSVLVKATSLADPSKSASVTLSVSAVAVTAKAAAHPVQLGSDLELSAAISGAVGDAAKLEWSVPEGKGTIDATGRYTAPASLKTPATVIAKVVSVADPSKGASVPISIPAVAISLGARSVNVPVGGTVKLGAGASHAEGESAKITWSVVGGETAGSIDPDGTFHAPSVRPSSGVVVAKAASAADPSQGASVEIHLDPVSIAITPDRARVALGGAAKFEAHVLGTPVVDVEWSITGAGGGTITPDGAYTGPATLPDAAAVKVVARAKADPSKTAVATIQIAGKPELRSFAPASAGIGEVLTLQGVHFGERSPGSAVRVGGQSVEPPDLVSWSDGQVVVKVPSGAHSGKIEVAASGGIATSATDLAVQAAAVTVTPAFTLLRQGERSHFNAQVEHAGDARLRWTLEGDAETGTLYGDGTFLVGDHPSGLHHAVIRATSVADPSQSGTARVVSGPEGSTVWEAEAHSARGPTRDDQGHYFISASDGSVQAFDTTGAQVWRTAITDPLLADGAPPQVRTPIPARNLIIAVVQNAGSCLDGRACQADSGTLVALRAKDGTIAWKTELGDGDFTDAVALPDEVVVARYSGTVAAYSLAEGKSRWSVKVPKGVLNAPVIGADGVIHGGGEAGALFAITPEGRVAWSTVLPEKPSTVSRAAVGSDGTSYVTGDDAILRAVDAQGHVRWKIALQGRVPPRTDPTPQLAPNGDVIAASGSTLEVFSAAGERRWSKPCAACSAPLALGLDGRIYAGRHSPQSYQADGTLAWSGDSSSEGDRWTAGVVTPEGYLLWTDSRGLSAHLTSHPDAPAPVAAATPSKAAPKKSAAASHHR